MPDPGSSFAATADRLASSPALLERARGDGAYADLFFEDARHHRQRLRQAIGGGRIGRARMEAGDEAVVGAAFQAFRDAQVGFAVADGLSAEALRAAADGAADGCRAAAAPAVGTEERVPLLLPSGSEGALALPADAPDRVRPDEKAALLRAAADAAFALDARVRRVDVAYRDVVRRTLVATTPGAAVRQATARLALRVEVTLCDGERETTAHAVSGGTGGLGLFFEHTPEDAAREAVERAARRLEAHPVPAGAFPVVIAAGWGGAWLHEAVGHLLEADVEGPFTACHGARIAAEAVTLVDDARHPGGRGTYGWDDEGVPGQTTTLIEQGILCGLLADRRHARRLGLPLTGNGRRQDYRHPPLPRMTNLFMKPGLESPASLVADVADGLYVSALGHGTVWPRQGRFVFEVLEGRRIRAGRLAEPVAGFALTGGPDALTRIVGVGDDLLVDAARGQCAKAGQVVPVSAGMPTVLLDAVEITPVPARRPGTRPHHTSKNDG